LTIRTRSRGRNGERDDLAHRAPARGRLFPSWHPIYLTCPDGYFLQFLGAFFDPADPLEAYDDNHDRWICKRIFA